jgi:hypothetical protein
MTFPVTRLRRTRMDTVLRGMVRETRMFGPRLSCVNRQSKRGVLWESVQRNCSVVPCGAFPEV